MSSASLRPRDPRPDHRLWTGDSVTGSDLRSFTQPWRDSRDRHRPQVPVGRSQPWIEPERAADRDLRQGSTSPSVGAASRHSGSFGLRLKVFAVKAATWIVSGASLREVDRTLGGAMPDPVSLGDPIIAETLPAPEPSDVGRRTVFGVDNRGPSARQNSWPRWCTAEIAALIVVVCHFNVILPIPAFAGRPWRDGTARTCSSSSAGFSLRVFCCASSQRMGGSESGLSTNGVS